MNQEVLNDRMILAGVVREQKATQGSINRGDFTASGAGNELLRKLLEPVITALEAYYAEAGGNRGLAPVLAIKTASIPPGVVSYIALNALLASLAGGPCSLTGAAIQVARALEDEVLLGTFKKSDPVLFKVLGKTIKRRRMGRTRAATIWNVNAKNRDIELPAWDTRTRVLAGTQLIGIICQATGMVDERTEYRGKRAVSILTLNPRVIEWLRDRATSLGLLRPFYLPMVVPPVPWSSPTGGGYPPPLRPVELYSRANRTLHRFPDADLSETYSALNRLQNSPWEVNQDVLGTMKEAWSRGLSIGELPSQLEVPLPDRPPGLGDDPEELREWKKSARKVYEINALSRSGRLSITRTLELGDEFSGRTLYFPYRTDFRGRVYPIPVGLSPHGSDLCRPLLMFSGGCSVRGTQSRAGPSDADWLFIHGANTFGEDKRSLSGRVDFGRSLLERAALVASDPFTDLWWADADKPWAFLAWCFDVTRATRGGTSHLPIALDGSCNGLQHLSALLLDPVGGAEVNLIPSSGPRDIYAAVAAIATEKLETLARAGDELALQWWQFGIDRSTTKRQVMVLPYGGTAFSCRQYTREAVMARIDGGTPHAFGDDLGPAITYLSRIIWEAIHSAVIAAREVMGWLQTIAGLVADAGLPLVWTSPSGFLCHQQYFEERSTRIETQMFGRVFRPRIFVETEKLNKARQKAAVSPNFTHSLDAACLIKTVNGFDGPLAVIHDSFGTLASRTSEMRDVLRGAFHGMYSGESLLEKFHAEVSERTGLILPEPPKRLSMDISKVLESDYFFA